MIIGVDIGGHHVAAAIVGNAPTRLLPGTYRHVDVTADASADALIAAWATLIDQVASTAPTPTEGIGIAIPGPFDYRAGIGWYEGNAKFGALYGVDVAARLAAALRDPQPVRFLNDATAFTVGCVAMEFAPAQGRVIGVTLGTGLGSAFLDDGIPVIDAASVPPHGCLWDRPFLDSIADDYVSARWLLKAAKAPDSAAESSGGGVAGIAIAARAGDQRAKDAFADYGTNLASIVAPWVVSFGADTIVLGGRITGAADLFLPAARTVFTDLNLDPAIRLHENTEDAAIAGAARTFDPLFWSEAQHRLPER